MEWYMEAWRNSFDFNGRATRSEYWWFTLVNAAIVFVIAFFYTAYVLMVLTSVDTYEPNLFVILPVTALMLVFGLAAMIPSFSVSIRRLHDVGMSGWWLLIGFVPVLGPLFLFYKYCCDSQAGENDYGSNPKHEHGHDESVFEDIE